MKTKLFIVITACVFLELCNSAQAQTKAVDYYNKGIAEFGYGNTAAAIENMTKAIELKPDYGDALSYRGYFYKLNNQFDKSISDYLAANKIKNNINGYFIAVPYALTGNKDEAFKWIQVALTGPENKPMMSSILNDKDLESLHNDPRWNAIISKEWFTSYEKLIFEGNDKTNKNDLAGALEIWNKAIALEPNKPDAYEQRAINSVRQGNTAKAITDISEAIRLKPESSTYYGDRAFMYSELKKYTESLADYNKAIQLDPQNMIYAERAGVKEKINPKDPTAAEDYKTQAISFYKDDFTTFLLGSNYYINGNYTEAIKYLSMAITLKQEYGYYELRGMSYFSDKNFSNAIKDFNEAININPKEGEPYYYRGNAKGELHDKEGACEDWHKAVSLGFQDSNGYINSLCK